MAAVRAFLSTATSATPYAASQAGFDLAISDLTASGGIIEIIGLESTITLPTPIPSGITILWFRTDNKIQFYGGEFQTYDRTTGLFNMKFGASGVSCGIPGNGYLATFGQGAIGGTDSSLIRVRGGDTGGATSSFVLSQALTDIWRVIVTTASTLMDSVNTIRFRIGTIGSAVEKASISSSRLNLSSGVDLGFNGSPGTAGVSIPISGGAAASPTWGTPAGLPGSTMVALLSATMWGNSVSTTTPGTGAYVYNSMSGAADNSNYMVWTVPLAYTATTAWKLYWSGTGGGGNAIYEFSMFKVGAAGFDFAGATFTAGAQQTLAVPASSILAVSTMPTPAVTLAAGDKVVLRIRRVGNDANDTSATATNFIGMEHTYT